MMLAFWLGAFWVIMYGLSICPLSLNFTTPPTTSDGEKLVAASASRTLVLSSVPAVSMALVADAKLLWRGAFGVKDFESKTPVDHDTVFEAGSVSKTAFAYAVMKLCEKDVFDLDVLDLDTPLTKYTPDRIIKGDPRLDLITTRHVLSHTTGFQNWRSRKEALIHHS